MTALEYGTFGVGSVVYPLATGTGHSLLVDADPAIGALLDYFDWSLAHYRGARWTEAATAAGLTTAQALVPVTQKLCFEPTDYLTQEQVALPALAVYRTRSVASDKTSGWTNAAREVVCAWMMPPLTPGQMEQLWPFTRAVEDILTHAVSQGFDPGYKLGVWVLGDDGMSQVDVNDSAFAKWEAVAGKDLTIPAIMMRLTVHERLEPVAGAFDPTTGGDVHVDLADAHGAATIADFIQDRLSST